MSDCLRGGEIRVKLRPFEKETLIVAALLEADDPAFRMMDRARLRDVQTTENFGSVQIGVPSKQIMLRYCMNERNKLYKQVAFFHIIRRETVSFAVRRHSINQESARGS